MKKVTPEPQAIAADAAASLGHVSAAVAQARAAVSADEAADDSSPADPASGSARFLTALALLRELRAELATWEPDLIDAARRQGASWEQLAPALGVASRQAAERRYLRLRPSTAQGPTTGDQRVRAERDRRAADRAVRGWARDHASDLRQLAGQVSGLGDLPATAHGHLAELRRALGGDDAADLLVPLTDAYQHLASEHPGLAARIHAVGQHTEAVRRDSRDRRRKPAAQND
jgi:hypothetical protein